MNPNADTRNVIFEKTQYILEWDYSGWVQINPHYFDFQKDWNETLTTKINKVHARLRLLNNSSTIYVPIHLKKIIDGMLFYDEETSMLSDKCVEYTSSCLNEIKYKGATIKILNYI
jgi:hypothetical protein